MVMKFIRIIISILIVAIFAVVGFLLGTQVNNFIVSLDLAENDLWFSIGRTPEENPIAVVAYSGFGYVIGKSGKVYSTCNGIFEVNDCWTEGDEFPAVDFDSCIYTDVREPPGNIVMKSIDCGFGGPCDITGIALRNDGKLLGYCGRYLSIIQSVNRWFLLSILGAFGGIVLGVIVLNRSFQEKEVRTIIE